MVGATVTKFVVEDDHVVQIFIFQLKNKNLDTSRNKIWTRPELKSGRVQCPDYYFSIDKQISGHVQI